MPGLVDAGAALAKDMGRVPDSTVTAWAPAASASATDGRIVLDACVACASRRAARAACT